VARCSKGERLGVAYIGEGGIEWTRACDGLGQREGVRAVAVANGGARADVGAVEGGDVPGLALAGEGAGMDKEDVDGSPPQLGASAAWFEHKQVGLACMRVALRG
jgi:hypothetical protein